MLKHTPKMVTDQDIVKHALDLRHAVCIQLINNWEKTFFKKISEEYRFLVAREKLAILLNCYDPDLRFYHPHVPVHKFKGVELHVLEGLERLNSPHGYSIYRMLKLQKNLTLTYT